MANLNRVFVEGFGWAMVDEVGNIWDFAEDDESEKDNDYNEAERQAEWEFGHGYNFDDDRH